MNGVVAAPFVLTGEAILADGAVALANGRIVAAGPRAEVAGRSRKVEHVDGVILPAFVNAHTHLELSALRGRVPGGEGLAAWVRRLLAERARVGREEAELAMNAAVEALSRAGVAAVGEVTNSLGSLPALRRSALVGTVFHEVLGLGPARIAASRERARQAREAAGAPPPGWRVVESPHAIYSTDLGAVAEMLRAGPASIHLAEDPAERDFTAAAAGPLRELARALSADVPGLSPLGRSAVAAAAPHLHPGALAVHLVDLDDADLGELARSGATAVLCPRSNLHIGSRLPELPRLLGRVPLAVGTDSLASAPSLSPLAELAALHAAFPAVPLARLFPLAWNGAAVGAPEVGRLAAGTAPGILFAPLRGQRPKDPLAWLLSEPERSFEWLVRPGMPARPSLRAESGEARAP